MHANRQDTRVTCYIILALICLLNSGDGRREGRSLHLQRVAESSNLFAEDIYRVLTEPGQSFEDRNVLISPLSLDFGLAMLMTGASGDTKVEISKGLRLENKDMQENEVHAGYKDLISTFKMEENEDEDEVKIQIANRVYVGQVYPIKPSFLHTLRENYLADAEQVNFGEMQATANNVNSWVEKATNNKIKDIVVPSMLNNHTAMILVNAVHFKGEWMYPFNSEFTTLAPFKTVYGGEKQVPMMQLDRPRKFKFAVIPELKSSAVALPYFVCRSHRFSLIIILPERHENFKNVEAKITEGILADIPSRMRTTTVDVRMPKFKLESNVDLVASKALENLGMPSLTTQFAEFAGLSDEPGLRITNVIHKTYLEVNEAGSEAAAASAFVAQARSLDIDTGNARKFIVDRPFLAYIFDSRTKTILFIARKIM